MCLSAGVLVGNKIENPWVINLSKLVGAYGTFHFGFVK